jgi:flagellin
MRINYAKDDAAGQAISTRLTAEVEGLAMASRNAADAQSMIDTTEGALQETTNLLMRMRELAVQASNGTLEASDRTALDAEFQALEAEIDRINNNTTWAGNSVFNGNAKSFQVGTGNGGANSISHTFTSMAAHDLGVDSLGADNASGGSGTSADINADLTSQANAQGMITAVDAGIAKVSAERGKLGALSNRLTSTMANLDQVAVNLSSSKGRIQDTDFATETGNLAKNQILQQAATAMLAQANASKGSVLTLIRN